MQTSLSKNINKDICLIFVLDKKDILFGVEVSEVIPLMYICSFI